MLPIPSPTLKPSTVDIRLVQHQNQFFFPGSTVSGQVMYESGDENEIFELYITFSGRNFCVFKQPKKHSDHATLFQYKHRLHSGPRRYAQGPIGGMSKYPFNFRFPSNADNRSFIQPRESAVNQTWSSSVHELPPSFDLEAQSFACSVEYVLCVELYHEKEKSATVQLPIVFLPFRANSPPVSPSSISLPRTLDLGHDSSLMSRPSRVIEVQDAFNFKMTAEAPLSIIVGRTFRLQALLDFSSTSMLEDDYLHSTVYVKKLRITCTTDCRAFRQTSHSPSVASNELQRVEQQSMVLIAQPVPSNAPTTSTELRFSFEATMPSACSPTFRSFLISNTYHLQAVLVAMISGEPVQFTLDAPDIPVLSPVAPSVGARRFTTPMIPSSRLDPSQVLHRTLACQI